MGLQKSCDDGMSKGRMIDISVSADVDEIHWSHPRSSISALVTGKIYSSSVPLSLICDITSQEIPDIVVSQLFLFKIQQPGKFIVDSAHFHPRPFPCENPHWHILKYKTMLWLYLHISGYFQIDVRLWFSGLDFTGRPDRSKVLLDPERL